MKKFWPFSFYFIYYAALAMFMPFIVLFYQEIDFNGPQIAVLSGIPPLITLFAAPFWTSIADSTGRHRLVMSLGIGVAVVTILLLQYMNVFAAILLTVLIFFFFFSPVASLSDSATMAMLGKDRAMYGRVRLGGTIGWGLFALVAGILVDNYGLKIAFWGFSFFTLINLGIAQKLVYDDFKLKGVIELERDPLLFDQPALEAVFIFRLPGRPWGPLRLLHSWRHTWPRWGQINPPSA